MRWMTRPSFPARPYIQGANGLASSTAPSAVASAYATATTAAAAGRLSKMTLNPKPLNPTPYTLNPKPPSNFLKLRRASMTFDEPTPHQMTPLLISLKYLILGTCNK